MIEPQVGGTQWAEIGNVASLIGHTSMLLSAFDEGNEEARWANGLNLVGSVVGAIVTVDRFSRRRRVESEARSQVVASPHVQPGPNGFEVGLRLRH